MILETGNSFYTFFEKILNKIKLSGVKHMASHYQEVKSLILKLNQQELLKNRIILAGGTVPYIVSQTTSKREHLDIDMIVYQEDMIFVREFLNKYKIPYVDSTDLTYNRTHTDYGIDAFIDGITVNFAPYKFYDQIMIQRNFLTRKSNGMDALVSVQMKILDIDRILTKTYVEGIQICSYSLEMVKIMKEKSKKKKDKIDIRVIDDFGYDENIYLVLKEQSKEMKFEIIPKNRLLRFLFHR